MGWGGTSDQRASQALSWNKRSRRIMSAAKFPCLPDDDWRWGACKTSLGRASKAPCGRRASSRPGVCFNISVGEQTGAPTFRRGNMGGPPREESPGNFRGNAYMVAPLVEVAQC